MDIEIPKERKITVLLPLLLNYAWQLLWNQQDDVSSSNPKNSKMMIRIMIIPLLPKPPNPPRPKPISSPSSSFWYYSLCTTHYWGEINPFNCKIADKISKKNFALLAKFRSDCRQSGIFDATMARKSLFHLLNFKNRKDIWETVLKNLFFNETMFLALLSKIELWITKQ